MLLSEDLMLHEKFSNFFSKAAIVTRMKNWDVGTRILL